LKEERTLSSPEFNFRNIVKVHMKELLQKQFDYWKMRCTIRWFKLGGENNKFFHAKATERYRNNIITEIKDDEGIIHTEHHEKASAFLHSFKGQNGNFYSNFSPF
jgi:hypothetical protein